MHNDECIMHNYMSNYMFNRQLTAINGEPQPLTENKTITRSHNVFMVFNGEQRENYMSNYMAITCLIVN